MYGWRARLGVLVPSGIIAIEPEFNLMAPRGVSCHYTRFGFSGGGSNEKVLNDLKKAGDSIADAADLIMDVHPSVMAMTGTAVTFIGGLKYDQALIKKMRNRNGNLPTTTTSTSVIEALRKLGIQKVSVATPYPEDVSKAAVKFVEDNGFKVLKSKCLNKSGWDIPRLSYEELYHLTKEVDHPESEAIFISCTNLHVVEIIENLEIDLRKPVVTSNQATMWNLLRMAGIGEKIQGYGQLLITSSN
jgi:maleate isomerase